MHPAVLTAYATELPKIRAAQALERVEHLGVGTGAFRKSDRRRLLSAWARTAQTSQRVVLRPPDRQTYEHLMRGVGLAVKFEKPEAPSTDG